MGETLQLALSSIDWPAAFTIVGSVIATLTATFGYLLKVRTPTKATTGESSTITNEDLQRLYDTIDSLRDRFAKVESDSALLLHKTEEFEKKLNEHEDREGHDIKNLHYKLDKLTEIVLKILSDDNL